MTATAPMTSKEAFDRLRVLEDLQVLGPLLLTKKKRNPPMKSVVKWTHNADIKVAIVFLTYLVAQFRNSFTPEHLFCVCRWTL